ncbi:acetyltransferase [Methylomicrobium agile]|uniref:acetyltransferase n=1 Tax=Methylomicrobium agile TaxID=39774 RepID=UPI00055FD506|nr:acetyltransferase [Methylomicrobium agile]
MKEAQPLLIFPYNGNSLEALDCLGDAYLLIGFVDDTPGKRGIDPNGYPVFGREAFDRFSDARVLAVPGSPRSYRARKDIIRGLGLAEERFATVIHPAARVSPLASLGVNVLIMAGVVVTSNAAIGSHICILPNTVIHHDVAIGDWSLIGSNVTIAGNTVVEENCYIGSGTSLMNGIRIRNGALVGLGSNVIGSVEAHATVAGNPAREIRKKPWPELPVHPRASVRNASN